MGRFLVRLTGEGPSGAMSLLASHPRSADRLAAMERDDAPATGAPILNEDQWRALKSICAKPGAD
jgi:hypothetical protein